MPERSFNESNVESMRAAVTEIMNATPVTDVHTHLYTPVFGDLLLWGIDETITYHYLIAEVLRASQIPYDAYWALSKTDQADLIWRELYLDRSPFSEACRGPLTVLNRLGLDVASRDLDAYRAYFEQQDVNAYIDIVFQKANVSSVVMTNDPFDDIERPVWERGVAIDKRFHAALRIDPLLTAWESASDRLAELGYKVTPVLDATTLAEVRRFLDDWIERMDALYMAVSLSPAFTFPDESPCSTLIAEAVLPVARERNIPFAMMIGVKRKVNPALRLAADGVGASDVGAVERMCAAYPDNKFMVTMLARENQHELCIAARKFRNLFLFGCWWFLNDPSLIEEMTRMRFELLGSSVLPQHSDARILDQLIYKWSHSRAIIGRVLADKYADLIATGWTLTESEIRRDVARLLGENFWTFIGRENGD
ncbi:MAG TPA: glucuronate isomerase [Candidatus Hydrogenedentes bacterium]|nr:glucuronate isomerase [Candidatus Hydrogenedentota bacterium]HPG67589.1 glucuronate isomerase [Candidatus Hydrogenedentota bacterium]